MTKGEKKNQVSQSASAPGGTGAVSGSDAGCDDVRARPVPGPWFVTENADVAHMDGDYEDTIVIVDVIPRPVMLATAHLIAAAPDLLSALEHMRWCRSCAEGSWEDCDGGRAALAAIAKAEGSKP